MIPKRPRSQVRQRPAPVNDGLRTMGCGTKDARSSDSIARQEPFCLDLH